MNKTYKKRRRKRRKTRKRGGESNEKIDGWAEIRKQYGPVKQQQKEEKIREWGKKRRMHFDKKVLSGMVKQTEAATADRKKKEKQFEKLAMSRPPRVDSVKDTNILGMERSREKIENLTRKKQKKSDKKFYNTLMSEMNTVLTDKTHPNHFNERRKRILNLIKQKDPNSYREICGFTNPSQSNTGCSMRIYKKIEPNGEKRGDDLLNAIQKHYGIKDKDVLIRKKGGKRKTRKRRRRKRSKTRKRGGNGDEEKEYMKEQRAALKYASLIKKNKKLSLPSPRAISPTSQNPRQFTINDALQKISPKNKTAGRRKKRTRKRR